jgi:hypothetical protein
MLNKRSWVCLIVLALFTLSATTTDEHQTSSPPEKRFRGMVESVDQSYCQICHCVEILVTLKTATERLEVRLGPKPYLDERDFHLSRGDQIEVTGVKYRNIDKMIVLANQVRKGGETLSLRGKFGRPEWIQLHGHTCPVCGN